MKSKLFHDQKTILLVVLLCLIIASVAYQFRGSGAPAEPNNSTAASVKSASIPSGGKQSPINTPDPDLTYSQLSAPHAPRPDGSHRNPFAFYQPPPPPPPKKTPQQIAQEEVERAKVVCGDRICQPPENYENCPSDCQPPVPPITLKYIGYMKEQNGAVAFLTDGNEVFMGRVDDIIANKYRVIKINDDSVELGYLNLNQSRTIPFQGNQKS